MFKGIFHLLGENENIRNIHRQAICYGSYVFLEKRLCVYVSFFKLEAGVLMLYLMQGLITL